MFRTKLFAAAAVLGVLASLQAAIAATPGNLDDLLEQTRQARQRESQINQERESHFLADHSKQAALLSEARAELTEQQHRSASLSSQFDANEKRLAELQKELEARA